MRLDEGLDIFFDGDSLAVKVELFIPGDLSGIRRPGRLGLLQVHFSGTGDPHSIDLLIQVNVHSN